MEPDVIPQASLASSVGASDAILMAGHGGFCPVESSAEDCGGNSDMILCMAMSQKCVSFAFFCHGHLCIVVEALANFNRRHFAFLGLHCLNSAKWLHGASYGFLAFQPKTVWEVAVQPSP